MKPVQLVYHRGDNRNAPENTFASAQKAIAAGADYIEFDVHQSADGVLYVIHDATVDRTTNGAGSVADMHSSQIDALDAGSWFGPEFAGQPVPRLDAFLNSIKGLCKIYCEIKEADVADVFDLLRTFGSPDEVFTGSFSAEVRADVRRVAPEYRRNVQLHVAGSLENAIHHEQAHIFEFLESNLTHDGVEAAKQRGLQTMVFVENPDTELFANLVKWQVDYVNLDHPALFRAVQQEVLLTEN